MGYGEGLVGGWLGREGGREEVGRTGFNLGFDMMPQIGRKRPSYDRGRSTPNYLLLLKLVLQLFIEFQTEVQPFFSYYNYIHAVQSEVGAQIRNEL